MKTYEEQLTDDQREAIEWALDEFRECVAFRLGIKLAGDDRAARAAEALAIYLVESQR